MDFDRERNLAIKYCQKSQKNRLVVGYTSGCFDILHVGHTTYLEEAKCHCDVLIVGVNSDYSVNKNKSFDRPVISQQERLKIIQSLKSVDCAFIFNEDNNNKNITLLRPDVYIKAGDYDHANLSSAPLVKEYGGRVVIVPFIQKKSTTSIIKKIQSSILISDENIHCAVEIKKIPPSPTIFIDRDGTINEEIEYLHEPKKLKIIPHVLEGLFKIQQQGYKIVIITTQAGIGLGYFSKEDFYQVNKELLKSFNQNGIVIDKIYFCPHSKRDQCSCRKPEIGLIKKGEKELPALLSASFMIGDKTSDILAGQRAGLKTILVKTGHAGKDKEYQIKPNFIAENLLEASEYISNHHYVA